MTLQHLFCPRGMAIIGSVTEGKLGHALLQQVLDGGYQEVFAVNPKGRGALSIPAYTSVGDIDHAVDLALIVSPTPTVKGVLEDCGRAGVKAAIIITAGFSEVGNIEGEREIALAARANGIRFVGPNCAGIFNSHHRLFPTLETRPPLGGVSLIAQSGAVGGVILAWGREYGLGFSKFVSYGNGADLDEVDLIRFLADDDETQVVALYLETVKRGREFMSAVEECSARKPVVVIKSGRTQTGQRAALSHTGSMAGSDAVYDAALAQCGAIRVRTIEQMYDLCKGFVHLPPLRGRRVVIVTNSGGPGVLAADHADEVGLDMVEPSAEVQTKLREFLPSHCPLSNPVDLTVEGTEDGYRKTLNTLLPEYDAALVLNIAPPYLDSVPLARGIADAADKVGKPVMASFLPGWIVADGIAELEKRGIPNISTGERGATALAHMARYYAGQAASEWVPEKLDPAGNLPGEGQLLEPQAMSWLRENGVPVPDFRVASSLEEAAESCRQIGYPVAMKVVSADILHKSDEGGVALDIRDDTSAVAAFEAMEEAAQGKSFTGVIIYPMIGGALEMLVGLSRDPHFGPVVACGLGGIYTEVWHDVSLRVAPVDREGALSMLHGLKSFALLAGVRGQKARDVDALAELLVTVSRLPLLYPDIEELDLNPVFVFADGALVGDVRVIRRQTTAEA